MISRPSTYEIALEGAGRLIAYHHNNPVKAKVVRSAGDSDWTSHGLYAGTAAPLDWIDVELGLILSGFSLDSAGRPAETLP